jgi:predicted methyltransferase
MAEAAGLELEARAEINANPKDSHDHEFGVWTLPPGLRACRDIEDEAEKDACKAKYTEIGESDRMTLRFRKPSA